MAAMSTPRIYTHHILVHGKVQGVFYRKYTALKATELGVTGWVRNLPDSRVEILVEGTAAQVAALEKWCNSGSPKARVTDVTVEDLTSVNASTADGAEVSKAEQPQATRQFTRFVVRH